MTRTVLRPNRVGFIFAGLLALGVLSLPAFALAGASADKPDFELGLYIWGTSLAGHLDTDEGDASMHIAFSDLIQNVNVAAMGRARANFDKFSIVFDGEYFDIESDEERRTLRLGPAGNVEVQASAKIELVQYILELNAGYEIFNLKGPFSSGPADERGTVGELYLGGRYLSMKPEVKVEFGMLSASIGEWESWVDGVVGGRLAFDLSKTVVFGIQGDVGGFNFGQSSKFTWSQITSLTWRFSDSMSLALGYKFLDIEREIGDSTIELQLRGPFLATSVRF